ncbi:MAG TPA: ABC transporter permease [Candidatus Sulfotelmatobacter sp.]|nr:ABC transporter permease [Candidatus Sulfotelmatobacter sp.]
MGTVGQNLKFAIRQLRRNPGFTTAVVVTLALAIGANTAIFSLVNALMLTSLPYPHPDRMGTIFRRVEGVSPYDGPHGIDGKEWELLRDDVPALVSAVSGSTTGVNLQASAHAAYVQDGRISLHYLDVLGIRPAAGRNFTTAEDTPHGPNAVILSYSLWRNVFGGDRSIVGQAIQLKGEPYTVIGILPQGATTPLDAGLYTALQPSTQGEGGGTNYDVITRLRNGATWQQADAELNRAWAGEAISLANENHASRVSFYLVPLQQGQTATLRPKTLALMLAAWLILLIACANLAGLTLVRVARRTSEIATRLALGASRWQIERQLWVENLVLAVAGGAAGVGVGFLALRGLLSLLPLGFLPVAHVPIDGRVLAFTLAVALLTSILFGMLPALATRRIDLRSSMASRGVGSTERQRLRQTLIAGEVALTVLLLTGAGLLVRTLVHLETLPPGFNPHGVMTAKASLNDVRYDDPATFRKLLDESTAAMRRIPGVESAAVGLTLPFEPTMNDEVTLADGKETGENVGTDILYVTPGYFETLQIPMLAGRRFTRSDGPNAQTVAIVNHAFAEKFYHGANPVGRTLNKGIAIVGMVGDVQLSSNLDPIAPLQTEETMYVPAAQMTQPAALAMIHTWVQPNWIVRTAGPVQGLTGDMQRALASAAPGLPFSGFHTMSDLQAEALATQRIEVALLSAMAGLALLLSAVGIFSLVASLVTQKTREIGIRIALGSSVRRAMVHTGVPGVRASAWGLIVGLILCAGTLRVLHSVLYGVGVYDWPTMLGVLLVLATVALIAAAVPTLRVARISPAQTLRDE